MKAKEKFRSADRDENNSLSGKSKPNQRDGFESSDGDGLLLIRKQCPLDRSHAAEIVPLKGNALLRLVGRLDIFLFLSRAACLLLTPRFAR